LLLLVNGLLFLLMMMTPVPAGSGGAGGLSFIGGFSLNTLVKFGGGAVALVEGGDWWRLITPIFVHGGLIHFGFNSFVLLQLGPLVEEIYGTERFWVIYLAGGIVGNMAAVFLEPDPRKVVVGASGAIVGLIGLLLAYGIRRGGVVGGNIRSVMTRYAIYILVFSLLPGISLLAHAGGFVGGLMLGLIAPFGPFRSRATELAWQVLSLAGIALVFLCFWQVASQN
jgi:rhomboid protease GluP